MITPLSWTTLGIVLAFGIGSNAMAEEFSVPVGATVLTVSGNIGITNVEDTLVFDRETLMAFQATTFETSTIWTEGVHSFTGVPLYILTDLLGVQDGQILATAINDYTVEIPVSDAVEGGPIIAYLMDGEEMTLRDKGPLWVIYPYDRSSSFRTEVVYSRSIWQLDRLEVVQ